MACNHHYYIGGIGHRQITLGHSRAEAVFCTVEGYAAAVASEVQVGHAMAVGHLVVPSFGKRTLVVAHIAVAQETNCLTLKFVAVGCCGACAYAHCGQSHNYVS